MDHSALTSSDSEIITRSLNDPEIFGDLFDRHADSIGKYFARRVGGDQIEELLSEVFVTAFRARHKYSAEKGNALPWLFGIAHNHLRHYYRSYRRKSEADSRLKTGHDSVENRLISFEDDLIATLDAEDDMRRVEVFIHTQPEIDREVLLLYAWDGLSYQEIGEALSVPVGTVRSRLNRIRKKIRELEAVSGQIPNRSGNQTRRNSSVNYQAQESNHE